MNEERVGRGGRPVDDDATVAFDPASDDTGPATEATVVAERGGEDPWSGADPSRDPSGGSPGPESVRGLPPVVYGARSPLSGAVPGGMDAVQRRIGPPPSGPWSPPPAAVRPPMPSLARRFRRRRALTLAGYAAAVLVSVVGLIIVGTLAFGA